MAELELKKAFPVGTIRTWKGKKFIKSPDKKWRPYYEKKGSQGEKLALAALAKKINALQDGDYEGLYKLLTLHRSRFTSDKSLIKDLYDAMKERGALGSGRFSKKETEKKEQPKVEVKTEAKKEEHKKDEKKKENEIPESFEEMTVYLKKDGTTFKIEERVGNMYNGKWLDGENKGHSGYLSEGALKNKDLVEILSIKEKESEKEEEKTEKVTFTKPKNRSLEILEKLLPTSKSWSLCWHDGGANCVNFNVGSINEDNSIKGIIKDNIDCDEKRLLAITALITDAVLCGECTEEKEGVPEKWRSSPSISKKFEKNGIIVSVYYPEERAMGAIRSIDTETNKEAFEKAIKDFEAEIDASEGFEHSGYNGTEEWTNMLKYIKKAKTRVKTEITKKENEAKNAQKKKELREKERELSRAPTVKNMISFLEDAKVKYNPLGEKREKPLPEEEIIERLANYDGTGGSCLSQAFAYATQKMGYDVTDFRGGMSKNTFSWYGNAVMTSLFNTSYIGHINLSPHESALDCLEYASNGPDGAQYLFTAGRHCAIVRKNKESGELQYLELQLGDEFKGWQNFDKEPKEERGELNGYGFSKGFGEELNRRFHTKNLHASKAEIINIDAGLKPGKEDDFLKLMGYINTEEGKQKTYTREEWERKGRLIW